MREASLDATASSYVISSHDLLLIEISLFPLFEAERALISFIAWKTFSIYLFSRLLFSPFLSLSPERGQGSLIKQRLIHKSSNKKTRQNNHLCRPSHNGLMPIISYRPYLNLTLAFRVISHTHKTHPPHIHSFPFHHPPHLYLYIPNCIVLCASERGPYPYQCQLAD